MKKKICFTLFILLLANLIFAENAVQLNTKGYELYEQGKYEEALKYFEKSSQLDNNYHYPHYNYACTAAILLSQDYCGFMHLIGDIYEHLQKTVQLKPQYKKKMLSDPDLESVRHTYQFLLIAGLNSDNQMDLITILTTITWFGPKPGVFPASPMVRFKDDGSIEIGEFLTAGEGEAGYSNSYGTYRVEGKTILIELNDPDLGPITIQAVFEDGVITFPNGEFPQLTDNEDPCSA